GRRFLQEGALSKIFGGFRLAGVHLYASGTPLGFISNTACGTIPIFNGRCPLTVSSYEGWIANNNGDYRGSDRFYNRSVFPSQPTGQLGNATRLNPQARTPSQINENFSLARSFRFTENMRLDIRAEAFNAFNHVRFNPGDTNIDSQNFGVVNSQLNDPRRLQFGIKLYF
ncbi:MAG: carboxypeptidase regulatory-like domain-containing protein, partial [Pyrinomonadaceae bacterium]|nr:carboxypeptidase regulatory-like domain-containing protein [Pyrinomonadaceae bacterium]